VKERGCSIRGGERQRNEQIRSGALNPSTLNLEREAAGRVEGVMSERERIPETCRREVERAS
jgi:hypothetical protein